MGRVRVVRLGRPGRAWGGAGLLPARRSEPSYQHTPAPAITRPRSTIAQTGLDQPACDLPIDCLLSSSTV